MQLASSLNSTINDSAINQISQYDEQNEDNVQYNTKTHEMAKESMNRY